MFINDYYVALTDCKARYNTNVSKCIGRIVDLLKLTRIHERYTYNRWFYVSNESTHAVVIQGESCNVHT